MKMKRRPSNASGARMRTIKTLTGLAITLDGDLLAVLETLFQDCLLYTSDAADE